MAKNIDELIKIANEIAEAKKILEHIDDLYDVLRGEHYTGSVDAGTGNSDQYVQEGLMCLNTAAVLIECEMKSNLKL